MKNPLTEEWGKKAEEDWKVANHERENREPVYNAICFHCQQCIEKYQKAIIQEQGQIPPVGHDLLMILNKISHKTEFDIVKEKLGGISAYAVHFRYPRSIDASESEAQEALDTAGKVREIARKILRLKNHGR